MGKAVGMTVGMTVGKAVGVTFQTEMLFVLRMRPVPFQLLSVVLSCPPEGLGYYWPPSTLCMFQASWVTQEIPRNLPPAMLQSSHSDSVSPSLLL